MFDSEHLSFSGTLQRRDGSVMIVRRIPPPHAPTSTWEHPLCGSPRPAEALITAVRRCAERDLGIDGFAVEVLLPTLGDRVNSATGAFELHPSYLLTSDDAPFFSEERESRWVDPLLLGHHARRSPHEYSPLLALHAAQLPFFGGSAHTAHARAHHEKRATG